MEAVEINAGGWYLRALRADDRLSDVPALADLHIDDPRGFVVCAEGGWEQETLFTWAVCEPTTGELLALIEIVPKGDGTAATLRGRARTDGHDALAAAVAPVTRFASGALGLHVDALTGDAAALPGP